MTDSEFIKILIDLKERLDDVMHKLIEDRFTEGDNDKPK